MDANVAEQPAPAKGAASGPSSDVILDRDWAASAKKFVSLCAPTLLHHNEYFYHRERGVYLRVADASVRSDLWGFLSIAKKRVKVDRHWDLEPFAPTTRDVNTLLDAVKAVVHAPLSFAPPCWLPERESKQRPDVKDVLVFPNGILDLRGGDFLRPTAALFATSAVAFDFDPDAMEPTNWLAFLNEIFAGERDQIESLQEAIGYILSQDVSQEKGFMLVGPMRSGKDTIRNVLQMLLPSSAISGPTLASMGTNFGMSQLIDKQLAVVGDMRIGSKTDRDLLAENILKLTGRGLFTIDRKFKDHWVGTLPCKILCISNEMPMLKDAAGALANRFIVFCTRKSFYGTEDPNLFRDKLAPEAPGILLWALSGLHRMRERGRLAEPACSKEQRQSLARNGSPVLAFVDECLQLEPSAEVKKADVYELFLDYAAANGLRPKAVNAFVRDLLAATGGKVMPFKMSDAARSPGLRGVSVAQRPPGRANRQLGGNYDDTPF